MCIRDRLNGMQFTLGLNPEVVAFEGYTNGAITLQDDNFTFLRLNEGILAASWDNKGCLLYTSPSPRDRTRSRMPSSA